MLEDSKRVTARDVEEDMVDHFELAVKCFSCLLQHRSCGKGMKPGMDRTLIVEQL